MESQSNNPPLVVIVGETASGKTTLALQLAQRFSGEIISADSRTLYTGMDIGTAKPTADERQRAAHHLLDIAQPDQPITAAEYKHLAQKKIVAIAAKHMLPILVGGTGLYIDAVLYDFGFRPPANPTVRKELELLSTEELQQRLHGAGIPLPTNEVNQRHLIRQLETDGAAPHAAQLRSNTLILGLQLDPETRQEVIARRVDAMLDAGLEHEARRLGEQYGWQTPALQTIGYQEFAPYFAGNSTLADVRQQIIRHTLQYAKRQRSWFRRNKHIHYISSLDEAVALVTTFLNK